MQTEGLIACQEQVKRMLRNSQTRVINPIITLGLLREHERTGQIEFLDRDVRRTYGSALKWMIEFLGHDLHLGAKYGASLFQVGMASPLRAVAPTSCPLQRPSEQVTMGL